MGGPVGQDVSHGSAAFALDRFELANGHLVITGRWTGVRGLRFVRPTLQTPDRRVLATLDHKPWAPDTDPWIAAFAWDDEEPPLDGLMLLVSPSVEVALGAEPPGAPPDDDKVSVARLRSEIDYLRSELAEHRDRFARIAEDERLAADHAIAAREDLESARREAEAQRDLAIARAAEAERDRDAALRSRRRMEEQLAAVETARAVAESERTEAEHRRQELRAHLDDALLANRQAQEQLRAAAARPAHPPSAVTPGDGQPIGVREVPVTPTRSPALHRAERRRAGGSTPVDVWVIRLLGITAAVCFILFLVVLMNLVS